MNTLSKPAWRPRFTIASLLVLMLVVGLLLGWRSSVETARKQLAEREIHIAKQGKALEFAEAELQRARDQLGDLRKAQRDATRVLYGSMFEGATLAGATLSSPENAFQRTSFAGSDLERATLQGGTASFQLANFDGAQLAGAKLRGDNASFQGATFVGADLKGADLAGGPSSFQTASFENANLAGAKLAGSFQAANLSGVNFAGADLSALSADDLASCYFRDAPRCNGSTKFPAGFDPIAQGWRRASE
jgi:uncharacterized protein YjbI with pentapeptide repeats